MAPIVTFGILIVENLLTRHPCARGHVNLSVSFHGRSTICACHPCARAMQFSPFVLLCRIEKTMPDLSTNTYILELCVSSLHRGLQKKKACTCHPCTKCPATFLCAKKKSATDSMWKRKSSFLRNSAIDFSVILSLLGEQSRVPTFRPSETLWAASQAVDEGATHQESVPSLIICRLRARALALDLGCGTCCPPFVMRKAHHRKLQYSTTQEPSHVQTVMIHTVRQTLYFPHICVGSLDASRSRGPLGAGPNFLTPCCSCSAASSDPSRGRVTGSRQNTIRVQPSLPSIFLHGFARQCRTCVALPSTTSTPPSVLVPAPSSPDCAGTPPTHARTGDRVALGRLRALLRACS